MALPATSAARRVAQLIGSSTWSAAPGVAGPSRRILHPGKPACPLHTSASYLAAGRPRPAPLPSSSQSAPLAPRPSPRRSPAQLDPDINPLTMRDRAIPYRTVRLVSPSDNTLGPPRALSSILSTYDPSTHTLSVASVSGDHPIVKLLDLEEERSKARVAEVKARLSRKVAVENKEVQVSWASAIGDLKHKAALARGILEKGDRATVIFAAKAGADRVNPAEQKEITDMFISELEGTGVRWKEDEKTKGAWVQNWGPEPKVRQERRAKVQEEEVGKRKERDEKKEARRKKEEERRLKAAGKGEA